MAMGNWRGRLISLPTAKHGKFETTLVCANTMRRRRGLSRLGVHSPSLSQQIASAAQVKRQACIVSTEMI